MVVRRQLRRECHQCLRSRHNRMSTTLRAMQSVVRGVSVVSKVEDVHPHTRLFPKDSCLKLESTMPIWDRNFGVQVQTHRVPGCDTGAGEGHECLCSSLLFWMVARLGMEQLRVWKVLR